MESTEPRYYVRTKPHKVLAAYVGEVVDSWTEDVMVEFQGGSEQTASLLAETRCAEMNAPETALVWVSRLGLHVDRVLENEGNPGDLLEDVARRIEHYVGQLRGLIREPFDETKTYYRMTTEG